MSRITRIVPEKDIKNLLLSVQLPGRYVGGEFGSIVKENSNFTMALSFPDLYEIGMSNLALRLLYREINALEGVSCERVFSPAPDFEEALSLKGIPLYTLESGIPLNQVDLLGFTVGYELAYTNILSVLQAGGIPLTADERSGSDPLVIAGGPAVTNPAPLGRFLDGVWIGEAEENFTALVETLSTMKKSGAGRVELLAFLQAHPNIWCPGKKEKAVRGHWQDFPSIETLRKGFIVPNISAVQDHGIVEIMRGCPSGCRFCHAGYFYRPFRQKSIEQIEAEVECLIRDFGYREVTLSSLSSGDYNGIESLIRRLNGRWADEHISFAFPSMRVDSVSLPLLAELSRVRKSGLTFAVETPAPGRQAGLNKPVPQEKIIDILTEAKNMGWNLAKFYFMTGLPFSDADESDRIVDFLNEIQSAVNIRINAAVGTFIPKPHTPFQWAGQLNEQEAMDRIHAVKRNVRRGIKVGYHSPFISTLEGVLSRGGEEVSELVLSAFRKGARLDAWDEYINKDIWREEFEKSEIVESIFKPKTTDEELPWDAVDLGVSKNFLKHEFKKAEKEKITPHCAVNCDHNCGVCHGETVPVPVPVPAEVKKESLSVTSALEGKSFDKKSEELQNIIQNRSMIEKFRMMFEFKKEGKALFYSHINIMQIFERAFVRAGIRVRFTEGFNPKPRLEFAHPLALGYGSDCEIAAVDLYEKLEKEDFLVSLNGALPEGIVVAKSMLIADQPGVKRKSLMSIYGGSRYTLQPENEQVLGKILDLDEKWKKRQIEVAETEKGILEFWIPQAGKESAPGLKKILNSIYGISEEEILNTAVLRNKLTSKKSGEYISYFDYFKS